MYLKWVALRRYVFTHSNRTGEYSLTFMERNLVLVSVFGTKTETETENDI